MIVHPPHRVTPSGDTRRVGVEIEFHGLDAGGAAAAVARALGGTSETSGEFHASADVPEFGVFDVKLDTSLVERDADQEGLRRVWDDVRETAARAMSGVTPVEVIAPPIAYDRLGALDEVAAALRDSGAKGTRENMFFAFGMHLNPETWSDVPEVIWNVLCAYAMMEPWLRDAIGIDPSRRALPFVDPYAPGDVGRIAALEPPESMDALIEIYAEHFPTRNHGLDLLPLLAHYDKPRIAAAIGEDPGRMAARPTFHYRLPDCRIDDPEWGVLPAWRMWVRVEEVACGAERLAALRTLWAGKGRLTAPSVAEIAGAIG